MGDFRQRTIRPRGTGTSAGHSRPVQRDLRRVWAEVLRHDVLAPVYGEHLHYGSMPDGRVYVLPWLHAERSPERDAAPRAPERDA